MEYYLGESDSDKKIPGEISQRTTYMFLESKKWKLYVATISFMKFYL